MHGPDNMSKYQCVGMDNIRTIAFGMDINRV